MWLMEKLSVRFNPISIRLGLQIKILTYSQIHITINIKFPIILTKNHINVWALFPISLSKALIKTRTRLLFPINQTKSNNSPTSINPKKRKLVFSTKLNKKIPNQNSKFKTRNSLMFKKKSLKFNSEKMIKPIRTMKLKLILKRITKIQ